VSCVLDADGNEICTANSTQAASVNDGSTCTAGTVFNTGALHSGRLFDVKTVRAGKLITGTTITQVPLAGGTVVKTVTMGATTPSPLVVFGNGGGELIFLDDGTRWDFSGTSWSSTPAAGGFGWPLATGIGADFSALVVSRGASSFMVNTLGGATVGLAVPFAGGATTPMVDAAGTVFLTDRNAVGEVVGLALNGSAGFGGVTVPSHTFPATISDLVVAKNGVLFVVSGGQVFALQSDSPGLGTDTNSQFWPTRDRDACRSRNLSFACPW
jgi:hypothetical protein